MGSRDSSFPTNPCNVHYTPDVRTAIQNNTIPRHLYYENHYAVSTLPLPVVVSSGSGMGVALSVPVVEEMKDPC